MAENKVNSDYLRHVAFITSRDKTKDTRSEFIFGTGRDRLRYGYCEIQWSANPLLETLKENVDFYIPGGDSSLAAVHELESRVFHSTFKQGLAGERPILLVHGYNIGFAKACLRASQFQHNTSLSQRLLLFSWPSNGGFSDYTRDEANIIWSVEYIERTLQELIQRYPAGLDLVAHSMGNRGLVMALDNIAKTRAGQDNKPKPINNLVLMAADIDADVATQRIPRIRALAKRVTIYASDNDRPLMASRTLHGYPRLGEVGPHLMGLGDVEVIDVSDLPIERISGHLYHLANRYAIEDLRQLLVDNQGAARRSQLEHQPELGEYFWRFRQ